MSSLGDMLNKSLQTAPPAMGFRPTAPTKPHIVLIAALEEAPGEADGCLTGAEAVIFGVDIKSRELKSLAKTASVPWGAWLGGTASKQTEPAGANFVVFEPDKTRLDIMSKDNLGKVMVINPACENTALHGINDLPIEAVYVNRTAQEALTWLDLMQCRRLSDLIAKPLLVPVSSDTPPAQLIALWEAGVDGIVVTATGDVVKKMRRELDVIDLPARRKWLRARPLVPVITPSASSVQHDDDDDEEDDD